MSINEFGLFIIVGLFAALALAQLRDLGSQSTVSNPFSSDPDNAIT